MYLSYKSGQLFILILDISFHISADKLIYHMIYIYCLTLFNIDRVKIKFDFFCKTLMGIYASKKTLKEKKRPVDPT